jgi:hypothetical protein
MQTRHVMAIASVTIHGKLQMASVCSNCESQADADWRGASGT